jgi:hypothetical protein
VATIGLGPAEPNRAPGGEPPDPLVVSESEALVLLAHLVTSAELCMTEPYDYGIFRLIDAASRLAAAMMPRCGATSRAFLEAFIAEVDEKKMWDSRDRERYGGFLQVMSRRTAEHLVTQSAGGVSAVVEPGSERGDDAG